MQPFTFRFLIPFTLVVLLLAACGDSADESVDTTVASATTSTTTATTSTSTTQASTTTVAPLPSLAAEDYEGVDPSDVLLVEALVDAYNTGDGAAFTEAMGTAEEVLYYDYSGDGDYAVHIDSDVQAQSIEDWDHPLGLRWELRRCEPSEDLPGATQCVMYRYDPIADTEMHRFPVDAFLSISAEDGTMDSVWLKYLESPWHTVAFKFSRWVEIFHPEDLDVLFNTEAASGFGFNYWDLHHSEASAAILGERAEAWETMTLLSQDQEFYDWVSEQEPEAVDVMWPAGFDLEHVFTEDQKSHWTRLVADYPG